MYRAKLLGDLRELSENTKRNIDSIYHLNSFFDSAVNEAILNDRTSLLSLIRIAGEHLPRKFSEREKNSIINSPNDRVLPFLRGQLFIALIANIEDYYTQVMKCILYAFPKKIQLDKIESKEILGKTNYNEVLEVLISKYLTQLFYESPKNYRKSIEKILSLNSETLEKYWSNYIEMKATRDIGLHNNWKVNLIYLHKADSLARKTEINSFLPVTIDYFDRSINILKDMVSETEKSILSKYKQCTKANVFKSMWEQSSLSRVVRFESVWEITSRDTVIRNLDFKWGWSSYEEIIYQFFCYIFSGNNMPDLPSITWRMNKKDKAIIDMWFNNPFFL